MNIEKFIARRILSGKDNASSFSRPIINISVYAIVLGLSVMILTVAIISGFKKEIQNKLIGFGSHIQITNYDWNDSNEPRPISKSQPFLPALLANNEVKHVQVYATKSGVVKTKTDNEGVVLKGVGSDYDWTFIDQSIKSGSSFRVSDTVSKSILISKYLADKLMLDVNDKVVIYFVTKKVSEEASSYAKRVKAFYISGIYETGFEDIDKATVIVDIRQIQNLNYWTEDQIAGFEVLVYDYNKVDEVGDEVYHMIGHDLTSRTIKELNASIFSWLSWQDVNGVVVITLMILVAAINMISALLVLILERTNMIGILKALGATDGSVRKVFLYNAAYLIGRGVLWGNVLGLSIAFIQFQFGIFKLDQATYYVSVIPISINIVHVLLLNLGTFACCMLMLILPSFVVTKITPVRAIQFT